jgi:hypothetical protein
LEMAVRKGSIREANGEFVIEADLMGESAKDLNRSLLSALRRVDKRTRLRALWTSEDGTTERYFDDIMKKTTKTGELSWAIQILDKPAEPDGGGAGALLLLPACLGGEARNRRESSSVAAPADLH